MVYRIRCYVSGGVTGSRQAWLKLSGKIYETDNKKAAEALARENTEEMNNPYSQASFQYRVIEMF